MMYQKLGDFLSSLTVEIFGNWKMFSNTIMMKKEKNNIDKRGQLLSLEILTSRITKAWLKSP